MQGGPEGDTQTSGSVVDLSSSLYLADPASSLDSVHCVRLDKTSEFPINKVLK